MSKLTTPTLVPSGTFRVVECTEGRTVAVGLPLSRARLFVDQTKERRPSDRLDIRTEWTDSPPVNPEPLADWERELLDYKVTP